MEDAPVSTAHLVPETWELTGDDAIETLKRTGRRRLLADAFRRLRVADGFSHARSLAFMTSLVLVQATIAIVGLAAAFGKGWLGETIVRAIHDAVPGPAGEVLTAAVSQAQTAGHSGRYVALTIGLVGALVTGTTAMGQLERGLNRVYGVERDRPSVQKYGLAFFLALTAGALAIVSFVALAFGRNLGTGLDNETLSTIWDIGRWPLAVVLLVSATALLLRCSPRRRQPEWSWLAFGAGVSVLLVFAASAGLGLFFRASTSFGETYGPLAGIVGLLLWALLSSIGLLFGASVAAQLEAVRAGQPQPQDPVKAARTEPTAAAPVPTSPAPLREPASVPTATR
jgi:YihY family inner membrane protein